MKKTRTWFSAREAMAITGFQSVMMLHYLKREKIVRPTRQGSKGQGNAWRYSFGDLIVLRAARKILDAGVSTQKLKKAFSFFQMEYRNQTPEEVLGELLKKRAFAVIGDKVVFFDKERRAIDVSSKGQLTFVFGGFDEMVQDVVNKSEIVRLGYAKSLAKNETIETDQKRLTAKPK